MASRMESHGTPGRIQITRATFELLADEFECEPRGTIAVKGKGEIEAGTWSVDEASARQPPTRRRARRPSPMEGTPGHPATGDPDAARGGRE